jgi:predicted small lipoprotein YifL
MRRLLSLILLCAAFAAGCGQKGPLYLPDSKPQPRPAAKSAPLKPSPAPIEQDTKAPAP